MYKDILYMYREIGATAMLAIFFDDQNNLNSYLQDV